MIKHLAPFLLARPLLAHAAAAELEEIDRIHVGGAARWDHVTLDGTSHRLYVSHATQTDVIIHGLRRKLGADAIRNVRGLGWHVERTVSGGGAA